VSLGIEFTTLRQADARGSAYIIYRM